MNKRQVLLIALGASVLVAPLGSFAQQLGNEPLPAKAAVGLPALTTYASTTYARLRFQLVRGDDSLLANPDTVVKLAFVYAALSKTAEVHIHQMRGATKNTVYVSPDGHSEAVVDEDGKLVTDCANMASYNFAPADREPLEHFMYDMLPWMEFGNCVLDPTTRSERIGAYLQDFRNGAIRTFDAARASLPPNYTLSVHGRGESAAFFLRILKETSAAELSRLYAESASADDFERFFLKFTRDFQRMFE